MARKMYRRLTWPVFDGDGNQVHAPGELIAADAPLDPAARYEDVEVEVPGPAPEEPPPAVPSDAPPKSGRRHATVQAQPAEGGGQAHP